MINAFQFSFLKKKDFYFFCLEFLNFVFPTTPWISLLLKYVLSNSCDTSAWHNHQGNEGFLPPRLRPRYQRPFQRMPPQQPTTESRDGESRPSQAQQKVPGLRPNAHKISNTFIVMAAPGRRYSPQPWAAQSPRDLDPHQWGDLPTTILEWFQLRGHPELPSGVC